MAGQEVARRAAPGALVTQKDRVPNQTFRDARIIFRNFSGREGQYNREGDRNFTLVIDNDYAPTMADQGWNIKYLRARDEGDVDQAILPVAVSFKHRPPAVWMITSRGKTALSEDLVSLLDLAEIVKVDLVLSPYKWDVNGKTGIKAYLKTIFVFIQEDELELQYADIPEVAEGAASILEYTAINDDGSDIDEEIVEAEIVDEEVPF